MTDCDLCGVALPNLVPVRVFVPRFEQSYPEGIWNGLCKSCLEATKCNVSKPNNDKCDLCKDKTLVYGINVKIPSFSKGEEIKTVMICKKCLKAIKEADLNK